MTDYRSPIGSESEGELMERETVRHHGRMERTSRRMRAVCIDCPWRGPWHPTRTAGLDRVARHAAQRDWSEHRNTDESEGE